MTSTDRPRDRWSRAAREWAELMEPMHRPLWEAMLDVAAVGEGSRVLDAGCGGGGASVLAVTRGASVSGMDTSSALLDIARGRLPEGDFRCADLQSLPFEDDAFDAVLAANSVQYAAEPAAALEELRRVCVPGRMVVVGLVGPADRVAYSSIQAALRGALPEPPQGGGPYGLSKTGVLERLMQSVGLEVRQSGEVDCPFTYPDEATFWSACQGGAGVQSMLELAPAERLREAAVAAARPFATADGSIRIAPNIYRYLAATA